MSLIQKNPILGRACFFAIVLTGMYLFNQDLISAGGTALLSTIIFHFLMKR